MGKYNESIPYFDKALTIEPANSFALHYKAVAAAAANATVLTNKGIALLGLGKSNESIAYFDKALTINPNDVMALNSKGLALYRLGEYNGSISYFNKALAINRNLIIATKEKEATIAGAAHNMEPNIAKNR
jgi:tetratricopeptide (TPR) repeat protein